MSVRSGPRRDPFLKMRWHVWQSPLPATIAAPAASFPPGSGSWPAVPRPPMRARTSVAKNQRSADSHRLLRSNTSTQAEPAVDRSDPGAAP